MCYLSSVVEGNLMRTRLFLKAHWILTKKKFFPAWPSKFYDFFFLVLSHNWWKKQKYSIILLLILGTWFMGFDNWKSNFESFRITEITIYQQKWKHCKYMDYLRTSLLWVISWASESWNLAIPTWCYYPPIPPPHSWCHQSA